MSDPIELFNRAWKAYLDRDWDTLASVYGADAELLLPGVPPIKGRDAIVETWRRVTEGFPDDGGTYHQLISQGNVAGGEKRYEGTNTGPLAVLGSDATLPPTGKKVSIAESDFIVVEDGQVIRHTCYFDRLDYLTQLGLMPVPAAA